MTTRRTFLTFIPATAVALGLAKTAGAAPAPVSESDPAAKALAYHADASKVDPKKFPAYAAGRHCANCQLYQGKASDATAPCAALGGKVVNGKGWCMAWTKKA